MCQQVVANTSDHCEAGHLNKVRTSVVASVDTGRNETPEGFSIEDLAPSADGGTGNGWGRSDCPWLILVPSGNPEPDSEADMWREVECGAPLHDDPPDGCCCENGHVFGNLERRWMEEAETEALERADDERGADLLRVLPVTPPVAIVHDVVTRLEAAEFDAASGQSVVDRNDKGESSLERQIAEIVDKVAFGTATASKRGRNPKWPYVPVITYGDDVGRQHTEQILGVAYATREEAIARAQKGLDSARRLLAKKLADPCYRALRRQYGLPEEI
jgi:hypothetical protein